MSGVEKKRISVQEMNAKIVPTHVGRSRLRRLSQFQAAIRIHVSVHASMLHV